MLEKDSGSISVTKRELTILQKVAAGLTTPQIAAEFGLSPETVKWYRKHLLTKFSAVNSAEMIRKAISAHIL